jgi:hypothetical protein
VFGKALILLRLLGSAFLQDTHKQPLFGFARLTSSPFPLLAVHLAFIMHFSYFHLKIRLLPAPDT